MKPLIEIRDLSFGYSRQHPLVLKQINLDVFEGECLGIIGPNGGGKSTLIKLMLGLLQPQEGRVRVLGKDPSQGALDIGYVPQHALFPKDFPITVAQCILTGTMRGCFGRWGRNSERQSRLKDLLVVLDLAGLESRQISALSGGQLQRVLIARALISSPRALLLDEPTSSIDPHGEDNIFKLLKDRFANLCVVIVSHDLGFVASGVDRIACVNHNLVIHKPADLNSETFHQLYGGHVHAVVHDHCDSSSRPPEELR